MGLLDNLESSFENKAVSSVLGSSSNPIATHLLETINNHPGGLSGLIQSFHEQGLGSIASSWVGNGENLPLTSEQIQQVLGNERVQQLAAKAGISPEAASSTLSQLLPTLVDKLTPNGQVPEHSNLLETGMSLLQSLQNKGTAA
jgi:uncharacterized protein YidB (DUF937 family)